MVDSGKKNNVIYKEEHIVNMWHPLKFHIKENYCFFPKNFLFKIGNRCLRELVYLIFPIYNRIFFGLKVVGRENLLKINGGAVTVCNHVHVLDCIMIATNLNKRAVCFPTLPSNFEIPLIRHLIRILGAVPLPKTKQLFSKCIDNLENYIKGGGIVHLYPETVLHPYYSGVRSFHRGAFVLAYDCNVPILPFVITYRQPKKWLKRLKKKPYVTLNILEPVYPNQEQKKKPETERLEREVYELMAKNFQIFNNMD